MLQPEAIFDSKCIKRLETVLGRKGGAYSPRPQAGLKGAMHFAEETKAARKGIIPYH